MVSPQKLCNGLIITLREFFNNGLFDNFDNYNIEQKLTGATFLFSSLLLVSLLHHLHTLWSSISERIFLLA